MKFAKVIKAVGLDPSNFPEVSKIDVTVLDWKCREIKEEDFAFDTFIFANNPISFDKFLNFLKGFNPEIDRIFQVILHNDSMLITTSNVPLMFPR